MSAITQTIHRWFGHEPKPSPSPPHDMIGDTLRAAVTAQTRAKTDASLHHEARVQAMIDDLFLRMRKADPHA